MSQYDEKHSKLDNFIKKRQKAIEKANPALRAKIDWCVDWRHEDTRHPLISRWRLGEALYDLKTDAADNQSKRFGRGAMDILSLFFDEDPSVMRSALSIYEAYPDLKQIEDLCDLVMADGITHLSYSHVRQLLALSSDEERQKAIELTLKNCWNGNDLGLYVQEVNGGKKSSGGRSPAVPKTVNELVSQQTQFISDYANRNIKVWNNSEHSLMTKIKEMDPLQYDEDLLKAIVDLKLSYKQHQKFIGTRVDELEKAETQVKGVLNTNTKSLSTLVGEEEKEKPDKKRTVSLD